MDWFETVDELAPAIRRGDTTSAAKRVSEILRSLPETPFHEVLALDFTNPPEEVAGFFDAFLTAEKSRGPVGAVYAETNGFFINPDRWYFDLFAYRTYEGHDDYNWLSDWDSDEWDDMTLTGMESLQAVYDSADMEDDTDEDAREHCTLLVVVKFQDLIRRNVPYMKELDVPLLATAHEFDLIAEFGG